MGGWNDDMVRMERSKRGGEGGTKEGRKGGTKNGRKDGRKVHLGSLFVLFHFHNGTGHTAYPPHGFQGINNCIKGEGGGRGRCKNEVCEG
jgi:hypothetical protein